MSLFATDGGSRRRLLRSARAAAALGAVAVGVSAPTAQAASPERFPVGGPAMEAARGIATTRWGWDACSGQVAITWTDLVASVNARAEWTNPLSVYANPRQNRNCTIQLNRKVQYSWPMLCSTLVHEYGHLTGHQHSKNRSDVMAEIYPGPTPECAAVPDPAARKR